MAALTIAAIYNGKPKIVDVTTLPIGHAFLNQAGQFCIKCELTGPDDGIMHNGTTWAVYNIGAAELVIPVDGELRITGHTP